MRQKSSQINTKSESEFPSIVVFPSVRGLGPPSIWYGNEQINELYPLERRLSSLRNREQESGKRKVRARALPRGTPGLLWPTFFGIKAHQPRWSDNRSFLPIRFSKLRCAGVQDVDDFEGKGIFFRGIVRQKARARTCWIELVCLYDEAFDWPSTVESSVFAKAVT